MVLNSWRASCRGFHGSTGGIGRHITSYTGTGRDTVTNLFRRCFVAALREWPGFFRVGWVGGMGWGSRSR